MLSKPRLVRGPGRSILQCAACGQTDEVTQIDVMGYMTQGWPKCCETTMGYFVEAERPIAADDTTPEVIALPSGF